MGALWDRDIFFFLARDLDGALELVSRWEDFLIGPLSY